MKKAQVHVIINGYVQGVFFRASAREIAISLGLNGWVQNLPDGNVEAIFEGPVEKLHEAVDWCRNGPPGATVMHVKEEWHDFTGQYSSFSIRYRC